jgi:hypothetical protein
MVYELRGSMAVYLVLFVTSAFTPVSRGVVFFGLTLYSIFWGDLLADAPFYAGMLLADLSLVVGSNDSSKPISSSPLGRFVLIKSCWPIAMALFGLYVGSFPFGAAEKANWANNLQWLGYTLFPSRCIILYILLLIVLGEQMWAWPLFGAFSLILSIQFSPIIRQMLSHRHLLFLGSISFPMYLLHSPLMRSILTWVKFGLLPHSADAMMQHVSGPNREYTAPVKAYGVDLLWTVVNWVAYGLWMALLIYVCVVWRDRVDVLCVEFARWTEEVMLGKRNLWGTMNEFRHKLIHGVRDGLQNSREGSKVRTLNAMSDMEIGDNGIVDPRMRANGP